MDHNIKTLTYLDLHMRVDVSNLKEDVNWKTFKAVKTTKIVVEQPKNSKATNKQQ